MQGVTNFDDTEICSFLCSNLHIEEFCWGGPRHKELDSEGNLWPGWNYKGKINNEKGQVEPLPDRGSLGSADRLKLKERCGFDPGPPPPGLPYLWTNCIYYSYPDPNPEELKPGNPVKGV